MNLHRCLTPIAFLLIASITSGAEKPTVTVTTPGHDAGANIKDQVSVTLGREVQIKFKVDGNRLLQPETFKGPGDDKATVRIELKVTDATPVPVRGVATRPYLVVSNGFERTLHCRALARLKGSKEFFDISGDMEAIPPGEKSLKCWTSGSLVEEVVLYQFTLSPQPAK